MRGVVRIVFHLAFHIVGVVVHYIHALVVADQLLALLVAIRAFEVTKVLLVGSLWVVKRASVAQTDRLLMSVADCTSFFAFDDEVGVD